MGRQDAEIYLGLVHHPIYNKCGDKITTTVTNLDLHDISRAGRTYNIEKYYVINEIKSQQELVKRMRDYWTGGYGADYNPNRHEAFKVLEIADTLPEVITAITERAGNRPELIATDAGEFPDSISYKDMREYIYSAEVPFLLLFGTGWGLTEETLAKCDYILQPVYGRGKFNHLSVRSAASIILDRLLAPAWWE